MGKTDKKDASAARFTGAGVKKKSRPQGQSSFLRLFLIERAPLCQNAGNGCRRRCDKETLLQ